MQVLEVTGVADGTGATVRALLLAGLFLVACGEAPSMGADAGADGGSGADAGPMLTLEPQEWLTAHDAVRSAAKVHWDGAAGSLAADWAGPCNFMHRDPNSRGENIYAATSKTPTSIIDAWAAERADYTLATNSCATGKVYGHYTQLVWRSSTGIGCAQRMCSTGSPIGAGAWFFTVCNYAPAGNFVGQKPY